MKKIITIIIAAFAFQLQAAAQVTQQWATTYNGVVNLDDAPSSIHVDKYGNTYVAGLTVNSSYDGLLVKYNAAGIQLWAQTYDGLVQEDDVFRGLSEDAQGNLIVTGFTTQGNGFTDIVTVKYDSAGNLLWSQIYNGSMNDNDGGSFVFVDDSSNVYVGGYSSIYPSPYSAGANFCTIKYNSNGVEQWVQTYNGYGNNRDVVYAMTIDNFANVYVTGTSGVLQDNGSGVSGDDFATIKYNSNGVQQWIATYHNPNVDSAYGETPHSIVVDLEGNVIVTGWAANTGFGDALTIKYNSSGVELWNRRYHGTLSGSNEGGVYVGLDSLNYIYVAGNIQNDNDNSDVLVMKYDPLGNLIWTQHHNGTTNEDEGVFAAKVDLSGNLYITGYTNSSFINESADFITLKYDSTGGQQWVATYDGINSVSDFSYCLDIDSIGNVYISGYANYTNIVTIKYSQSPVGVEYPNSKDLFTVYPNPNTGHFIVTGLKPFENTSLKIYKMTGEIILERFNLNGSDLKFDISDFSSGIYLVELSQAGNMMRTKIVKK